MIDNGLIRPTPRQGCVGIRGGEGFSLSLVYVDDRIRWHCIFHSATRRRLPCAPRWRHRPSPLPHALALALTLIRLDTIPTLPSSRRITGTPSPQSDTRICRTQTKRSPRARGGAKEGALVTKTRPLLRLRLLFRRFGGDRIERGALLLLSCGGNGGNGGTRGEGGC